MIRVISILIFVLCICFDAFAVVTLSDKIVKKKIDFNGYNLTVSGFKLPTSNVFIKVEGPFQDYKIIKKEKHFGLWINSKSIVVSSMPSFYKLYSTVQNNVNFDILNQLQFQMDPKNFEIKRAHDFTTQNDFYKAFKENQMKLGLYNCSVDQIQSINNNFFKAHIYLPISVVPGNYNITIYYIDQKGLLEKDEKLFFTIKQFGLQEKIYNFAAKHTFIYSLIAILMALTIGGIAAYLSNFKVVKK